MKITIVADVLGAENNGTTITTVRLIKGLKARGHEVKVISPSPSIEPNYYQVPLLNLGIFNKYLAKNGIQIAKPNKKLLYEAIKDADIVHATLPFLMGQMAVKICHELHIPLTAGSHTQAENITAHFGLKNAQWANNLVYRWLRNVFLNKVQAIHCPSPFIAQTLRDHHVRSKRYVVSNGVIPDFIRRPSIRPKQLEGKKIILFIGRLSKEKAHHKLITAVKHSQFEKDIQLVFAGLGPLYQKLLKKSRKLTNPPIIRFFSKDELIDLINYADLYVHPSDAEIEAISCLEAMSCGLVPVISSSPKSATNAFALSTKNIFDYKAKKMADLTRKIDYWLTHEEEKNKASRIYEEYAKRFNIELALDKMEMMFQQTIEEFTLNEKNRLRTK